MTHHSSYDPTDESSEPVEYVQQTLQMTPAFKPSPYQEAIFEAIQHGSGNMIVNAVAGSGKTTTLVEAARFVESGIFLAFNRHIAKELKRRLRNTPMEVRTVHSVGYAMLSTLGKLHLNDRKYKDLASQYATFIPQELSPEQNEKYNITDATSQLQKLSNLARLHLAESDDDLANLVDHHGISDLQPGVLDMVRPLLAHGAELATEECLIDYTDMIYLPYVLELPTPRYGWVFVDEVQDLNRAQLEIVMKCRQPDGRMLFVGDPMQAIYGFAGADAHSYLNIKERAQAAEFPLSVCYRCPTSHLNLARRIVPQIEARDNAPRGEVVYTHEHDLYQLVEPGDLVLGRKNAPLVSACISLIRYRVNARVRGRDIGTDIAGLLTKIERDYPEMVQEDVIASIGAYEEKQRLRILKRDLDESHLARLNDRCEALRVCVHEFGAGNLESLKEEIKNLFSDKVKGVVLSTVHKAKGLEYKRVFILHPEEFAPYNNDHSPYQGSNPSWRAQQEDNLYYVALTRATDALFFLEKSETYYS